MTVRYESWLDQHEQPEAHCDRKFGEIESVTGVCIRCTHRVDPLGPLPADDDSQERALRRNRTVRDDGI